jgi:hypothetical protein
MWSPLSGPACPAHEARTGRRCVEEARHGAGSGCAPAAITPTSAPSPASPHTSARMPGMSGRPAVTGAAGARPTLSSSAGTAARQGAACGSGDGGDSGGEAVPLLGDPDASAAAAAASRRSRRALPRGDNGLATRILLVTCRSRALSPAGIETVATEGQRLAAAQEAKCIGRRRGCTPVCAAPAMRAKAAGCRSQRNPRPSKTSQTRARATPSVAFPAQPPDRSKACRRSEAGEEGRARGCGKAGWRAAAAAWRRRRTPPAAACPPARAARPVAGLRHVPAPPRHVHVPLSTLDSQSAQTSACTAAARPHFTCVSNNSPSQTLRQGTSPGGQGTCR